MKVKDGICGLAVGDALGVPVEFYSRSELEEFPIEGMTGYGTYNMPPGTWSDDTAMTLATMDSIIDKKAIDYNDMMIKFSQWLNEDAYMQTKTFDCGKTTSRAIRRFNKDIPPLECGGADERSNGNGSLMRILPLAYIPNIDYETIENVSGLTHAHKRAKIACVLYIEIARSMIENDLSIDEHVKLASDKIKSYYKDFSRELLHFNRILDDELKEPIFSNGYVINTIEAVIYCLKTTDSYKSAVLKAVNLGSDTDTVGAICGGLAGIYYGFDAIPVDWLSEIDKIEYVYELCEKYDGVTDEYL